jgi:hypothetical protein
MKKLAVLLFALVVAVGVQGAPVKVVRSVDNNRMVVKKEITTKHKFVKESPRAHALEGATRIISEQPEGEAVTYRRTGDCVYATSNGITAGSESGSTTIVFGSDNKVYFKEILSGANAYFGTAWVEGTIEDNKITVPLGQSIYWSETYSADVVLVWGSSYLYTATNASGEEGLYVGFDEVEGVTSVTYIIDPDAKTISLVNDLEQPEVPAEYADYAAYYAAGLSCKWTDDDSFGGFVAKNTVFTEVDPSSLPTIISEQPEGDLIIYNRYGGYIANSFFGVMNGELDGKVSVVFAEDGKAYIQNPLWYHDSYGSWVEGTYDEATGIISVPLGQYLSWNDENGYGVQLGWGETTVEQNGVDEETGEPNYLLGYSAIDVDNIEFQVDNDKKLITLLNTQGDLNAEFPMNYVATGMMGYYSDDLSMSTLEFGVTFEVVEAVPAVPADPTADDWYDCGDENGFSKFYFTLPTTDVDGNKLAKEFLSYSIFTDNDQLFTFPAADYTYDLTEDITEVNYDLFSNAVDFRDYYVYMYRTNAEGYEPLFTERIGIQVYYTVDGVRNASNIVYWPESAVETVEVSGYVVDQDGNPLDGATVTFTPDVNLGRDDAPRHAEAEPVTAVTAADGSFTAELAANTDYNVVVAYDEASTEFDMSTEEEDIDLETIVLDIENTGINDLTANKQVASTTYFDMAGRKVSQPTDGVFVKSVRYTDGTVVTVKVIK